MAHPRAADPAAPSFSERRRALRASEQAAQQKEKKTSKGGDAHFFETVKSAAGAGYYEVASETLWQMRMIVLAKHEMLPHISAVEASPAAPHAMRTPMRTLSGAAQKS